MNLNCFILRTQSGTTRTVYFRSSDPDFETLPKVRSTVELTHSPPKSDDFKLGAMITRRPILLLSCPLDSPECPDGVQRGLFTVIAEPRDSPLGYTGFAIVQRCLLQRILLYWLVSPMSLSTMLESCCPTKICIRPLNRCGSALKDV